MARRCCCCCQRFPNQRAYGPPPCCCHRPVPRLHCCCCIVNRPPQICYNHCLKYNQHRRECAISMLVNKPPPECLMFQHMGARRPADGWDASDEYTTTEDESEECQIWRNQYFLADKSSTSSSCTLPNHLRCRCLPQFCKVCRCPN